MKAHCPAFRAPEGQRRCELYEHPSCSLDKGPCVLQMRHRGAPKADLEERARQLTIATEPDLAKAQHIVNEIAASRRSKSIANVARVVMHVEPEDVERLEQMGAEVTIEGAPIDGGVLHLVSRYDAGRNVPQLTLRDATVLAAVSSVFRGAQVVKLELNPPTQAMHGHTTCRMEAGDVKAK